MNDETVPPVPAGQRDLTPFIRNWWNVWFHVYDSALDGVVLRGGTDCHYGQTIPRVAISVCYLELDWNFHSGG